jgi:hypothetical protein
MTPRAPAGEAPGPAGPLTARIARLCPGFAADGPAVRTETSVLIPGRVRGFPALAKHPTDPRPFWQDRARHEITVYTALARAGPPPVPLPRLITADPAVPLIIMTRLPGSPLGPDRYPATPLPAAQLEQLLDALDLLHRWDHPTLRGIPADTGYAAQFQALPADLLSPGEPQRLAAAAAALTCALGARLEHGDPHPVNAITAPHAPLALVDLESLAPRLPGYDLAVLWALAGPDPDQRRRITARAGAAAPQQAAFWLSLTLVLSREIRSHRRSAPAARHRDRLALLHRDLDGARHVLRQLPLTRP